MVEHGGEVDEHDESGHESLESDGPPTMERHCDVAVIGGSAAGLAASLQLVRQRRSVIVVDDVTPRNAPAAHLHGYLGFDGTVPSELTERGRGEVRSYGGEILTGRVHTVERRDDASFRIEVGGGHALVARRVLVATGSTDVLPDIDGVADHWGRDVVHCPFCHGFEVRDRRVVQIVTHAMGFHPAAVFRHLTDQLTIVVHSGDVAAGDEVAALIASDVEVVWAEVRRVISGDDGRVAGVELVDGRVLHADAVAIGPMLRARAEAVARLGLTTTPHESGMGDAIAVDQTGQTAVAGVYAAGNVADPGLQVLHAAAHGSRVGAMIALDLASDDLCAVRRWSGDRADWEHRYSGDVHVWSGNPNGTLVAEVSDLPAGRALDVGAGEGGDALWLAERGWTVSANDISAKALARVSAEAERRGLSIECLHGDANVLGAFDPGGFDLVSMQYGSIHRTPEQRALTNLLGAVAPGGTLLVVGHDLTPWEDPVDVAEQTRMFDPGAYLGIDDIAATIDADPNWELELHETRSRPPGAASAPHHVDDVIVRARRRCT